MTLSQPVYAVGKKIALLSGDSNLQTGLLAKLIGHELGIQCDLYSDFTEVPDSALLLLIDCHSHADKTLEETAKEVHRHRSGASAALFNAEYDSRHENLLDWPRISGLFYIDTDQEQLIRGLKCLLDGDYWVPRRLLHHFLDKNRKTPASNEGGLTFSLTRRERQILNLIKQGATNADIAAELHLSQHTVKSHLYNVYRKIGARNRLEASNWLRNIPDDNFF